MLLYVAEQEQKKTKQRQAEGIVVAIGKGVCFGRPKQEVSDGLKKAVAEWKSGCITAVPAMKQLNMKPNTFYRRVKELEAKASGFLSATITVKWTHEQLMKPKLVIIREFL